MNLIPVDPRSLDAILEVPEEASTGEGAQAFEASLLEALFGAAPADETELPDEWMTSPLPAPTAEVAEEVTEEEESPEQLAWLPVQQLAAERQVEQRVVLDAPEALPVPRELRGPDQRAESRAAAETARTERPPMAESAPEKLPEAVVQGAKPTDVARPDPESIAQARPFEAADRPAEARDRSRSERRSLEAAPAARPAADRSVDADTTRAARFAPVESSPAPERVEREAAAADSLRADARPGAAASVLESTPAEPRPVVTEASGTGSTPGLGLAEAARSSSGAGPLHSSSATQSSAQPQPVEAIPHQVEMMATRGGGTARLRLHPEQLGEVEITVSTRGNTVEVMIRAEEPAAQAAMLATREQLAEALGSRDLRMDGFSVGGGNRGDAGGSEGSGGGADQSDAGEREPGRSGQQAGRGTTAGAGTASADRSGPATNTPGTTGIDVRV